MSAPINIRIKIVLLMVKFDLHMVVKRKLTPSSSNTPGEDCIGITFQRFYETGTVEDRQKLQKKKSMKFMMFVKVNHNQVFELSQ